MVASPPRDYLLDTSALVRSRRSPDVQRRLTDIGATHLRVCTPVLLELGYNARNAEEHETVLGFVTAAYSPAHLTVAAEKRAVQIQRLLAARNYHRAARLPDLLIAAVAEEHGLTVLHYDHDFDLIAEVAGLSHEWVVQRGSVD